MRGLRKILICGVLAIPGAAPAQLKPIGEWSEHLSWHHALSVQGSAGGFFVATPSAVFNVAGPENTITRHSTINGLHSIGVSAIAADPSGATLVIGYNNSDIDIVNDMAVTEVPDLEISGINGDKTIHSVYMAGSGAYLSTGIGIVVVDLGAAQVQDTYIIGPGGSQVPVYSVTSDAQYWYAATGSGLRKAALGASNLADFNSWQLPTGDPAMDILPCSEVTAGQNALYVLRGDSVFAQGGGAWKSWYSDGWIISHIQASGPGLVVSEQDPAGSGGRILWLDATGAVSKSLTGPGVLIDPRGVLQDASDTAITWIADAQRGLLQWNGSAFSSLVPNSPDGPLNGQMEDVPGALWVAGGGSNAGDTSGFFKYAGSIWTAYNSITEPALSGIRDFVAIAVAPGGDTVYAGSSTGGLAALPPAGNLTVYGRGSIISPSLVNPNAYPVTGLAFDSLHNLWIVNNGASHPLIERKADGSALTFTLPPGTSGSHLGQAMADIFGYVWVLAGPGSGVLCFNPGTSQWKTYLPGQGLGNLPDATVNCIAGDKQGLVWLGTNNGIAVVECGGTQFSGACDATLPVVQQDAFAGYLFMGQQVLCIAVDGADRKWVGTTSGAWLISEDGEHVIAQYNTANSPLFNDTVTRIGIDGISGEVFFSTPAGMCSLRGTATEASESTSGVLVFPNPVPPGYAGTIAIRGVPENAVVKITELSGRLVYQTVALGGQAVWNGNDYTGRRVASGVYLVLISGGQSGEKMAAKIVFIH